MARVTLPLVLLVLAFVLGGCGTGGDREQARAATERFLSAFEHKDYSAACGQLAEATAEAFEDCPRALAGLDVKPGAIARVEVFATSAKVDLANRETAFLERGPSGWKVSAAGCAHGARPAAHPFSCELKD